MRSHGVTELGEHLEQERVSSRNEHESPEPLIGPTGRRCAAYRLPTPRRPGAWREAPRAKRALRKNFGTSMPFCLIPCRLLALAAIGRPQGALRAQTAVWGALRAHGRLFGRASRAGVSATPVAVSQSFLPVGHRLEGGGHDDIHA
jgi:hypothetical protein